MKDVFITLFYHEQDVTQGQFLSRVKLLEFKFSLLLDFLPFNCQRTEPQRSSYILFIYKC